VSLRGHIGQFDGCDEEHAACARMFGLHLKLSPGTSFASQVLKLPSLFNTRHISEIHIRAVCRKNHRLRKIAFSMDP
jgi:hypothetical protein